MEIDQQIEAIAKDRLFRIQALEKQLRGTKKALNEALNYLRMIGGASSFNARDLRDVARGAHKIISDMRTRV